MTIDYTNTLIDLVRFNLHHCLTTSMEDGQSRGLTRRCTGPAPRVAALQVRYYFACGSKPLSLERLAAQGQPLKPIVP